MSSREVFTLSKVEYWRLFHQYESVLSTKVVDVEDFDAHIGVEYTDDLNHITNDDYHFYIADKQKFLIAKIKYGF